MSNSFKIEPGTIHWDYFTNYPKNCNIIGKPGGVYGLVFNETKPESYEFPCEFEGCVYIGKATGKKGDGWYPDRKGKLKTMEASHMYKRMTHHHKPLKTGDKTYSTGFTNIIEEYGYGRDVLNGTFTNNPLWLGMLIPRPDFPKKRIERWAFRTEQDQLLKYELVWDKTTLGNMDTEEQNVDEDSFSQRRKKELNEQAGLMESFMV
jgi:hypothetical protein